MCRLLQRPENWINSWHPGHPRALPRLTWAIPVDAAELGASLESYSACMEQVKTLRLCHRFGDSPLSTLPQELLDQIVVNLHCEAKQEAHSKWMLDFKCFQGRCLDSSHFAPGTPEFKRMWDYLLSDWLQYDCKQALELENSTPEEKFRIIDQFLKDRGVPDFLTDALIDSHADMEHAWVQRLCLCDNEASSGTGPKSFLKFNNLLKEHFGLQAFISHEKVSDALWGFLPDTSLLWDSSHYTTCFLGLYEPVRDHASAGRIIGRGTPHQNPAFIAHGNSLGFHQAINPLQFKMTSEQKQRFGKAMRVLGLAPGFPLTDLERLITHTNKDPVFWSICACKIKGMPKRLNPDEPREKKADRLEEFLKAKKEEAAKKKWPQLTLIASSGVVAPQDWSHI